MFARLLVLALCAAVIAVLAVRLADDRSCEDARDDLFAAVTGKRPPGDSVDRIRDHCPGTEALVAAAGALRTIGDREAALSLARVATEEEPESFGAWRARAALARGEEARAAVARAKALNPRWSPPPAPA